LTEAHTESTTEGSILLAGIYLKVGVLGWYRYSVGSGSVLLLFLLPIWTLLTLMGSVGVASVVVGSLDIKRFAAASSILHLQVVVLALLHTTSSMMVLGSIIQTLVHSWIAVLLFQ